MTTGSSILAMTFTAPPQCRQGSSSILKAHFTESNGMDSSSPNRHLSATLVSVNTSQRKRGVHTIAFEWMATIQLLENLSE